MSDDVLVRTRAGRIHRAAIDETGDLLTKEGCNLDQSDGYEVVGFTALEAAEPGQLCERDFPDVGAPATE